MLSKIANLVGNVLQPTPIKTIKPVESKNPFANPFVTSQDDASKTSAYGKNKPVLGGYFAGYHNGKPNIVGRRLFIEA